MQFRLMLDRDQIDRCRKFARDLATHLGRYTSRHTSMGIERATLRAMGVNTLHKGEPLTEALVHAIGKDRLREGAAYWLGSVMVEKKCNALTAAKHIVKEGLPKKQRGAKMPHSEIHKVTRAALAPYVKALDESAKVRRQMMRRRKGEERGQSVVVVQTGKVESDLKAVRELVQRKDVVGVLLRPPHSGASKKIIEKCKGWRAKYDLMDAIEKTGELAAKLDKERDHGFSVTWNGMNLLGPEIGIAMARSEVTGLEYDCFTMARLGGVHFKRAIVDQTFLYRLLAKGNMSVTVASDQWRSIVNGYSHGYELIMGQLIIEAMGTSAGLEMDMISSRHGLIFPTDNKEVPPDALIHEIAHTQLVRELFPQVPVGFALEKNSDKRALGAIVAQLCDYAYRLVHWDANDKQGKECLEAALSTVAHHHGLLQGLDNELHFVANGKISRRTHTIIERTLRTLQRIHRRDFLKLVAEEEQQSFLAIPDTGVGIDGVLQKHRFYWNPIDDWLSNGPKRNEGRGKGAE